MDSAAEWIEGMEQSRFEIASWPERAVINHYRRREGKSPFRMRAGRAVLAGEA